MYRTIAVISFFVLFSVGIVNIASASTPMNDYEKKLQEVAKAKRSFQLPNALALSQALSDLGWEHFLEKTGLIDKLADRHIKELGIYLSVEMDYYDYFKDLKDSDAPHQMLESLLVQEEMIKSILIEAILRVSKEVPKEGESKI